MKKVRSGAERRRYPRVDEHLRIRVAGREEQIATETVNVSCGGTLCWLDRPLPLMTKVAVDLALPKRLIHCVGVVVRCQPTQAPWTRKGHYQTALFFTDLKRSDHRAIAEFVLESMMLRAHGHRRP